MTGFILGAIANRRIDEIASYTRRLWGERQAVRYIEGLFSEFTAIAARVVPWTPIPRRMGVTGYRRRYRHHFIYWKEVATDEVAIMTILHERMQQDLHLDEIGIAKI